MRSDKGARSAGLEFSFSWSFLEKRTRLGRAGSGIKVLGSSPISIWSPRRLNAQIGDGFSFTSLVIESVGKVGDVGKACTTSL